MDSGLRFQQVMGPDNDLNETNTAIKAGKGQQGQQRPTMADKGQQWPAKASNGRKRTAMAGKGQQWPAKGQQWPAKASNGQHWPAMADKDRQWPTRPLRPTTAVKTDMTDKTSDRANTPMFDKTI